MKDVKVILSLKELKKWYMRVQKKAQVKVWWLEGVQERKTTVREVNLNQSPNKYQVFQLPHGKTLCKEKGMKRRKLKTSMMQQWL